MDTQRKSIFEIKPKSKQFNTKYVPPCSRANYKLYKEHSKNSVHCRQNCKCLAKRLSLSRHRLININIQQNSTMYKADINSMENIPKRSSFVTMSRRCSPYTRRKQHTANSSNVLALLSITIISSIPQYQLSSLCLSTVILLQIC